MPRHPLPDISDIVVPSRTLPRGWQELEPISVQLVTPMFGGGHTAGEIDEVTPVSGKAIRGHLRFWWRIMRGFQLPAIAGMSRLETMALRERAIFGLADSPSAVEIEVIQQAWNQYRRFTDEQYYGFRNSDPEAYALFSAKPEAKDLIKEGLDFTLRIRFATESVLHGWREQENKRLQKAGRRLLPPQVEPIETDLNVALWAWLNFGGLGARTRRGLGALFASAYPLTSSQTASTQPLVLQVLIGQATGNAPADAMAAWRSCLEVYRSFRQRQRTIKLRTTHSGGTRRVPEGRSFWPEPDAVRRATGCHEACHAPGSNPDAYPRAVLGLPIIFWFKHGPGKDRSGNKLHPSKKKDPYDSELLPEVLDEQGNYEVRNRMASPMITRPLCIDGQWVPGLVILPHDHVFNLTVRLKTLGVDASGNPQSVNVQVAQNQITGTGLSSLRTMRGSPNAIDALIVSATSRGFNNATLEQPR